MLVQSRDGGFISRDCLKCGRSDYVRPDQMPDLHCEFCDAPLAVKKADGVNSQTSADTAKRLKDKIDGCDRVLVVATNNAVSSRWVPWELGYGDKAKGENNIVIILIADPYGRWEGSEYLRLYPHVSQTDSDQLGVFRSSQKSGVLLKSWMENGRI